MAKRHRRVDFSFRYSGRQEEFLASYEDDVVVREQIAMSHIEQMDVDAAQNVLKDIDQQGKELNPPVAK